MSTWVRPENLKEARSFSLPECANEVINTNKACSLGFENVQGNSKEILPLCEITLHTEKHF